MANNKRLDIKKILADPDLRRKLMVSTIRATQAREGIETTTAQASRAYYVVTEGEKTSFFSLERFKPGKGVPDRRHEMFVQAMASPDQIRFDIARRDFVAIDGSPLNYQGIGAVAHIFREAPPLEPTWGIARQGKATGDDSRWVRQWWEVPTKSGWVPFAKGGDYSRFYSDVDLALDWRPENRRALKESGNGLPSEDTYFQPGLTWPLRTQRGFNVRIMPAGCVFGHKGPAIFPNKPEDNYYLLGVANSATAEYLLAGLMSFGSWEVGVVKRLPVPSPSAEQRNTIADYAKGIYEVKADWDTGNETSTRFALPWLVLPAFGSHQSLEEALNAVIQREASLDNRIQSAYASLNDHCWKLYGIPEETRQGIESSVGSRPLELVWPDMEGKTTEQKRMEHVWRLLSYVVKTIVEADEDGIVPFVQISDEIKLIDRVHSELARLFPDRELGAIEVEIINELKQKVKAYDRSESIQDWLENIYFAYHVSLYRSRPIFWHISSVQGKKRAAFAALVHYQRFDKDRIAKLRGTYLREAIGKFRREAALAGQEGRTEDRLEFQSKVEEAQELDRRLQQVQEGFHKGSEDYRILPPWKSDAERPKGWSPDFNDGVKVNIQPLQNAGVLRIAEVV